ncbi:MAG: 6-phosphofructokinase [Pirellulaceae bacterium]|nr:6-phosphofructokinase [Pirellulaceae bacterium]
MANTLSAPPTPKHSFKRVAILFSGGPAPAANAVISTAAACFGKAKIEAIGILNGYKNIMEYDPARPLLEGEHWIRLDSKVLHRSRNSQGILIGTARANPGKQIGSRADLDDPQKTAAMKRTYQALVDLGVDGLISIGGDDTLKTANKFKLFQEKLPSGSKQIPVVHLPKTIDNDYNGIDFTFGFFTAVQFLSTEIRNLIYDAQANHAYFVAEAMGRSAGWLAYGAAIAGEASLVISVEDIVGDYRTEEAFTDPSTGITKNRPIMDLDRVVARIVKTMTARENEGKPFGVIVLAEGLAEYLPYERLEGVPRDDHGHIAISEIQLGRFFSKLITAAYKKATGKSKKINPVMLGYEARCTQPLAYDVILGSQLGVGSYRAMVEEGLNGVMVSVSGQFDLRYEPFEKLVNPENLVTLVRFIKTGSDFHRLARFLETNVNE